MVAEIARRDSGVADLEEPPLVRDRLLAREPLLGVGLGADRIREPRDEVERRLDLGSFGQRVTRHSGADGAFGVERREEMQRSA